MDGLRASLEESLAQVDNGDVGRAILERVRTAIANATFEIVEIGRIRPMPNQPRKRFNQARLNRLAESISQVGQLTPGYLRRVSPDSQKHDRELVDGERRFKALQISGIKTFRAMVLDVDDQAAQFIISIIANFNRENHTILEIADAIAVMHDQLRLGMFEIAESIGYNREYTSSLHGLKRLVPEVRDMLDPDAEKHMQLPLTAAIKIARLPQELQASLANKVLWGEVTLSTLQDAIDALLEQHELPVRKRTVEPSTRRRAIERKVIPLERLSRDMQRLIESSPDAVGKDWTTINDVRKALAKANAHASNALQALNNLSKRKFPRKQFSNKRTIYEEGDLARFAYRVESGYVLLSRVREDGYEVGFAVIQPGESFGDDVLERPAPVYRHTATAIGACVLEVIDPLVDKDVIELNAKARARVLENLWNLVSLPADDRIILVLDRYRQVPLSQGQIASLANSTRETVVRLMTAKIVRV